MLGHDPELVEGRPLAYLVDDRDRTELAAALERAAQGASAAEAPPPEPKEPGKKGFFRRLIGVFK